MSCGHADRPRGVRASGRARLPAHAALAAAGAAAAPSFGSFALNLDGLGIEHDTADLDEIDPGAMRRAAEALLAEADDPDRAEADRRIAAAALARLYGLVQESPA